jgi:uncharacterized protein (TIGR03437 family)
LLDGAGVWSFKLFGGAGAIENAICGVDPASVAVYTGAGEISVRLPMFFKEAFRGRVAVSANALDLAGIWSERRQLGTFTVGASAAAAPAITLAGVVNAASFARGPVAAGEIVTIFGSALGPPLTHSYYENGWLCQSVGGTEVFFDNIRAPLVYTSENQVSAVVPYGARTSAKLRLEYQGRQSNEIDVAVAAASPGIFTQTQTGQGQAVAVNQDWSMNWDRPAPLGTIVTLFVTGEGQTRLSWPDGKLPAAGSWPVPMYPVTVTFGGREGRIDFAGLVYAGVLQINVEVPRDAPTGPAVPVSVRIAGASSPDGVTVALQ